MLALLKEASELGHGEASAWYAFDAFKESDWRRYRWLGRSMAQGHQNAIRALHSAAPAQLSLFDSGQATGRVVFELGSVLQGHAADLGVLFFSSIDISDFVAVQRCVQLHDQWVAEAKAAIECWIAVARRLGMARDMRLLIARMLWEQRADWSLLTRPPAGPSATSRQSSNGASTWCCVVL